MKSLITIAATAALSLASASAATFNISEETGVEYGSVGKSVSLSTATVTALGENAQIFVNPNDYAPEEFCFTDGSSTSCDGDGRIDFVREASNLTFKIDEFESYDFSMRLQALDAGGNVLATEEWDQDSKLEFNKFEKLSGIAAVTFTHLSGGAVGFKDFQFDEGEYVPIPAAAPLMLAGLGLLVRKRRKQA